MIKRIISKLRQNSFSDIQVQTFQNRGGPHRKRAVNGKYQPDDARKEYIWYS